MKKIILSIIIILTLCSCNKTEPVDISLINTDECVAVVWEDRIYVPFCAVENSMRGKKIGIVDGDEDNIIYEAKDLLSDEWIISYYNSGEMDNSMLMKEENVTDIPEGFYSEYEWNN